MTYTTYQDMIQQWQEVYVRALLCYVFWAWPTI